MSPLLRFLVYQMFRHLLLTHLLQSLGSCGLEYCSWPTIWRLPVLCPLFCSVFLIFKSLVFLTFLLVRLLLHFVDLQEVSSMLIALWSQWADFIIFHCWESNPHLHRQELYHQATHLAWGLSLQEIFINARWISLYIYIFILIYYIQPFYSDDEIVKVKRNRYLILNEITGAYLWGLRIHFDGQDVIYKRIKKSSTHTQMNLFCGLK